MKNSLFAALGVYMALLLASCGNRSRAQMHYDTTAVDTMMAINLDSAVGEKNVAEASWTYNSDSSVATLMSLPQKKSVITPNNRLTLQIVYDAHQARKVVFIMNDGERFSGNSYDSTNVIRLYAKGKERGKFTYEPGVSKSTDSAFLATPRAFVEAWGNESHFKVEASTFTSGTLVYEFKSSGKLKDK